MHQLAFRLERWNTWFFKPVKAFFRQKKMTDRHMERSPYGHATCDGCFFLLTGVGVDPRQSWPKRTGASPRKQINSHQVCLVHECSLCISLSSFCLWPLLKTWIPCEGWWSDSRQGFWARCIGVCFLLAFRSGMPNSAVLACWVSFLAEAAEAQNPPGPGSTALWQGLDWWSPPQIQLWWGRWRQQMAMIVYRSPGFA